MIQSQSESFTNWQVWPDAPHLSEIALAETLDGGQAFRWNRQNGYFEGRWAEHVVHLRCHPTGLRILRQPLGETLFGFLCSSTKQIPQIKAICEAVARDLGEPLPDGSKALPGWEKIADAGESRLRAAKLGYRAKYIHQTAHFLRAHPDYLDQVEAADTEAAREGLMALPGVGRKIADCTLLFGMGRLEAFPIDTWVQKILSRAYGLEGWKTEQLLDFARIHFGPAAGLAQQYLFAAARAGTIAHK